MPNILASFIATIAFITFGIWLCDREWDHTDDLDLGFFIALAPVAIAIWTALYLVGA